MQEQSQREIRQHPAQFPLREYQSFEELFSEQAKKCGDDPALRYGEYCWSYRELYEVLKQTASDYLAAGKTCLAVLVDGSPEAFFAIVGAVMAGLQVVILDNALPDAALARLLAFADADELWQSPDRKVPREFLTEGLSPEKRDDILFFTSGTTSSGRAVDLRQEGLLYAAAACAHFSYVEEKTAFLNLLPFSHVYGFSVGLLAGFILGGTVSFGRGKYRIAEDCRFYEPELICCVPSMIRVIVDNHLLGDRPCTVYFGGSSPSHELVEACKEQHITLIGGYGLTETSSAVGGTLDMDRPYIPLNVFFDKYRVKVADDGELLLQCYPGIMKGYYKDPEETAAVFTDGWFHTGDIVRRDEFGDLVLCGRKKEMLVFEDGTKLFLPEYEDKIRRILNTEELLVQEEEGKLVLVLYQPGGNEEDIYQTVKKGLAAEGSNRTVSRVVLWPGPLPRTALHKLSRRKLSLPKEQTEEITYRSEREEEFCRVAETVLRRKPIRPEADLFDEGMDSLQMFQLVSELTPYGVTLDAVYRLKTLRGLAEIDETAPVISEKKEKLPGEKRHRFFFNLAKAAAKLFMTSCPHTIETVPESDEPRLILANHVSLSDVWLVRLALKKHAYVAMGQHFLQTRPGKILHGLVAPVPIPRGASRAQSMEQLLDRLRRGYDVVMFPEGSRTLDGTTAELGQATEFLLRQGFGLVTLRLEGGYFLSPKWAKKKRSGPVKVTVAGAHSAEEWKKKRPGEITELIRRDLYYNAYECQEKNPVSYRGSHLAKGLENLVVCCPKCGGTNPVRTKGNTFRCPSCGAGGQIDSFGFLHTEDQNLRTIPRLIARQKEQMRAVPQKSVVYSDEKVQWFEIDADGRKYCHGCFKLSAFGHGFEIGGKTFEFSDITDMASVDGGKNRLLFSHKDGYFCLEGKSFRPWGLLWLKEK